MRISVYIILMTFISVSCSEPSYELTADEISSNKKIDQGFYLSEISVNKFDSKGKPEKYRIGKTFFCGPIDFYSRHLLKSEYSRVDKELYEKSKETMDTIMKLNGNIIGGEGHRNRIDEYIDSQNLIDSLANKYFPFEPREKVSFYQASQDYKWTYTQDSLPRFIDYEKGVHDFLPERIEIEKWYLINLSNASNIVDKLYFKINERGEVEKHHDYWVKMGV